MKIGPFTYEHRTIRWPGLRTNGGAGGGSSGGGGYSDAVIRALTTRADGGALALATATAALESCVGAVGRAFLSADVEGRESVTAALTPDVMQTIGRGLMRAGQVLYLIDVGSGRLRLIPVDSWDIQGDPDEGSWIYRLTVAGPSRMHTYHDTPSASVLHFRYATDTSRPWVGNSPLDMASLAGRLSAETVNILADESSGPVGRLLGVPKDSSDTTMDLLKKDIKEARGNVGMIEKDWGNASDADADTKTYRYGAEPPQSLVNLVDTASREIYAACGFNPSLFQVGPAAALREAWRLALFGVVSPLGKLVQSECVAKLDSSIAISWGELKASDLSGRARSFQSMVGGGMSVPDAARNADLPMLDAPVVQVEETPPNE